jgi:hypothetical protein
MKTTRLSPLDAFRRFYFITVPLAIGLMSFHGIASLSAGTVVADPPELFTSIGAEAPPGPAPALTDAGGTVTTDPNMPIVQNLQAHEAPDLVSDARRAQVMARAQEEQYHFKSDSGAATAINPSQALGIRCAGGSTEFQHRPSQGPLAMLGNQPPRWQVRFSAESLKVDDHVLELRSASASPVALEHRVETRLAHGCTEWFENRPGGVKHAFTVPAPPQAPSPDRVSVVIAVETASNVSYDESRNAVLFANESGDTIAIYRNLLVFDNTGAELESSMSLHAAALPGHHQIRLTTNTTGAGFPLTVDPDFATQVGDPIVASDPTAGDAYGTSSAGEDDIHVVGAPHNHGTMPFAYGGKVYIYEKDHDNEDDWDERATVTVPSGQGGAVTDRFGEAVALWKDTENNKFYLAVGAPGFAGGGAIFIFERNEGGANNWGFLQKYQPNDLTGADEFGCSLDFLSPELVVGAKNHNGIGAVYVLALIALVFAFQQKLQFPDGKPGDEFGHSVSGDGDEIAVGSPGAVWTGIACGLILLFSRNPALGVLFTLPIQIVYGPLIAAGDRFGHAVALYNGFLAIGAPNKDYGGLTDSGAVFVRKRSGFGWIHAGGLFGSIAAGLFGTALALNWFGDIAVGSPGAITPGGLLAGLVYVFLFSAAFGYGAPQTVAATAATAIAGMAFGTSVTLLGTILFVGAALFSGGQGAIFRFLLAATLLGFAAWQLLFWYPEQVSDPTKQHLYGPLGDYDGDGLVNFLEYAMGLMPIIYNAGLALTLLAGGGVYFTFQASLAVVAVSLLLQYSSGLGTWFPVSHFFPMATLGILHAGIATNLMYFSMPMFITLAMFFRLFARPLE